MKSPWKEPDKPPTSLERGLVWCLLVILLVISPFVREFFPFSSFHVFVDNPQQYSRFKVETIGGESLPLSHFELQRNYIGNGGYSVTQPEPHYGGTLLPPSLQLFGEVASEEKIRDRVTAQLESGQSVRVEQMVIGPTEDGGVGEIDRKSWTISR